MAAARKKTTVESTTCPWCSATVPAAAATCPSCGASLHEAADTDILGVTQVDPAAVSRASRIAPGRLSSWFGAERMSDATDLGGRIEPPSKEVKQEMLRLRLAAIEAELAAAETQAAAQRDLPLDDAMTAVVDDPPAPDVAGGEAPETKPG